MFENPRIKIFPVIIMTLIISLGSGKYLTNRDKVGKEVRASFWLLINQIKNFEPETVSELWKNSFQGFVIYTLSLCTFEDKETKRVNKLITEWEAALQGYVEIKNFEVPVSTDINIDNTAYVNLQEEKESLKEQVEDLESDIKDQVELIKENSKWMAIYEQLETLETILGKFKLGADDIDSVNEILEMVQLEIKESQDLIPLLNQLTVLFQKLSPLERVVRALALLKRDGDSVLQNKLGGLRTNLEALKSQIEIVKTSFISKIKAMVLHLKENLKTEKKYVKYDEMLKRAKELGKKIKELNLKLADEDQKYQERKGKSLILNWKRVRVTGGSILMLKDEIQELEEALKVSELIPEMDQEIHKNEPYKKVMKEVVSGKNGYYDLLEDQLENKETELIQLHKFKNLSIQLDNEFAKLMATLVNGDNKDGTVFFSSEELSVLIYFMNISKVIFSQSQFLVSLLVYLNKTACSNLVTRMRLDVLQLDDVTSLATDSLCLIENPKVDPFSQTPNDFVRDYSLLLSNQKSLVFKDIFTPESGSFLTFSYYLSYLRITPANLKMMVKKVTFVEFFKNMVTNVFILFGITTGIPFFISTLTVFLVYLVDYILSHIDNTIPSYHTIKESLLKQIDIVYRAFAVNDFEFLDYEETLKDLKELSNENFFSKLKRKPEELKDLFSSKFDFFEKNPWMVDYHITSRNNFLRLI